MIHILHIQPPLNRMNKLIHKDLLYLEIEYVLHFIQLLLSLQRGIGPEMWRRIQDKC